MVKEQKVTTTLWCLFGGVFVSIGVLAYVIASLLGLIRATLFSGLISKDFIEGILWYSPIPIFVGVILFIIGLKAVSLKRSEIELDSVKSQLDL